MLGGLVQGAQECGRVGARADRDNSLGSVSCAERNVIIVKLDISSAIYIERADNRP
jgi:hypothetical protein